MNFPSFIAKVADKSAPMSSVDTARLNQDATQWYEEQLLAADNAQKAGSTTLLQKVILHTDKWYCRLMFAVAFPIVASFITGLLNPGQDPDDMHNVQ